ncbi:MAG: tetratricopeptide repeat protein [Chloroflexi bacterium]|nr:MAG: tetratricopeptide repeat protein [Chloroflexota bacterium]
MSPDQSSNKIGKTVGEKLRNARIAQHLTQNQLATPDFSVSYISAIERGQIHPSLRALEILAAKLGLTSTQLLPDRAQSEDRANPQIGSPEREEDETALSLLEAQLSLREGAIDESIAQLHKLSVKRLKRPQQLQLGFLLGWAYYKAGQYQNSEYTLTEALSIAKELNDQYLISRMLLIQAAAYAALGNYPQADLTYQRCLDTLETTELHDPLFAAQIYNNVGQYYIQLGQIEQALAMFDKVIAITAEFASVENIQLTYSALGQYYTEEKVYDLAAHYAYKSLALYDLQSHKHLRSELYHYLSLALLKIQPDEAQTFIQQILVQNTYVQDKLALASIYAAKARLCFMQQALADADKLVQEALTLAEPFGDTLIYAQAQLLRGYISYAREQPTQGDQYFATGFAMLKQLAAHEELAEEAVRYAELLEEHGKVHEAFIYLRLAFQSRQKMGR